MSKQYAKEHSLDIPHFFCIEFPLKVNDVNKALGMVGGNDAIIRSCQDEISNPLELRFTNNIYEHPVNAKVNKNEQILIKISVPKKELAKNNGNIQKTLKALHKSQQKPVHIQPLGIINKTFRFREMSDFQYQMRSSDFTQVINRSIHELRYDNIKKLEFKEDLEPWAPTQSGMFDLPPPPRFSSIPLPFDYHYKKNPATILREGKLTTKNRHIKLHSIIIKWNEEIPTEASPELKAQLEIFKAEKDNIVFSDILKTLDILYKLYEIKPIWIRKHLEAILPVPLKLCLKYALPQIAYTFTKGPWRQAYIKFNVDPRTSSSFAKYQTESFRVPNFGPTVPKGFVSETPNGVSKIFQFNGDDLPASLLFQLENITDPTIVKVLKDGQINEQPDFHDGWYDALTMLKVRRLMRYKLRVLVEGTVLDEDRVDYLLNKLQLSEVHDREDLVGDEVEEFEDEEEEEDYELDVSEANYDEIMKYLEKLNPRGAKELAQLSGIIKQKDLEI